MAQFRATALTTAGQTQRSLIDAEDEATVVAQLQRQGLIPMQIEAVSGRPSWLSLEFRRLNTLSRQDLTDATRELAIMLGAGQDLDRALRYITETAPNKTVALVIGQVRDAVRDGASLAEALGRQTKSFPPLYVGLVRAGEAGGTLAATLDHLADLFERSRALESSIVSAMIYPALLLIAAVGAVVLLLTQVLPQFVPLFAQNGAALPASTQFLIDAGNFLSRDGVWLLLGVLVSILAIRQALTSPAIRLWTDRAVLRLPVIGGLLREVLAARFTRTLGTLLINGVPLIAALGITRDGIGNLAAMAAVDAASVSAKNGAGLSTPLAQTRIFPVRTVHLLRLGEETARLGPMALRAAAIHEEKSRLGVQRAVALLVPAITIVMGAVVAGIVSSLLLAMLGLNDLAN